MAMFPFGSVKNNTPKTVVLRELIEEELLRNDSACYNGMEAKLMGNYSGSPQFDHAYAVDDLLHSDDQNGGAIATNMKANNVNRRQLWDHLRKVLERYYVFKGAVMIEPRLEHKPEPEAESA